MPLTAAQRMELISELNSRGVDTSKFRVNAPAAGGGSAAPGTTGLRPGAPGLPYLTTPVGGKDQSEAAYYRSVREKQLDPAANAAPETLATNRRLEGLLSKQETGGVYALPWGIGQAAALFDPEAREIQSLTSKKARLQRQPGEGTISDYDARMFQQMVPGIGQPKSTNQNMILAERIAAGNAQDRRAFADWYHDRFNTTSGMNDAWRTYVESNPIFDPGSEAAGRPILNGKRMSWRAFYGAERGELDRRPSQAMQDIQRSQRAPVPEAARRAYDAYSKKNGIDRTAGAGTAKNPYLARDAGELSRIPAGKYVIGPDGTFGYIR